MQQRRPSVMDGVRKSQGQTPEAPKSPPPKEDFQDPFKAQASIVEQRRKSADQAAKKAVESQTEEMVQKANNALSGRFAPELEEYEKLEKISEEDLELAEQIVFKGYAEHDVIMPNLPGHNFTICTTSAEDMSVVDEILYDMVKDHEDENGAVDLPAQHVQTMRAALMLALGFKGMDGKDYCDEPINQILTIKRAVIKVKELEYAGEIDQAKKLMDSLKKSLKYRAIRIRRLPTPVVDFVSMKKYQFDSRMYSIMMSEQIIPKSSGQSQGTQEPISSIQEESSSSGQ